MSKNITLTILLACLLTLSACGLQKGYITNKMYIPAHYYTYLQAIPHESCETVNKTEECETSYTYIPEERYAPDEWTVTISSCRPRTSQSGCETNTFDVSKSQYNSYEIGEFVDFSGQHP